MNENYVITITRQFGSLGRPIAQKVSELLNIEYYDRDIVEEVAKEMNLPSSTVTEAEETAHTLFFNMRHPLGLGTSKMQDRIFEAQKKLIIDYAEKESCILVGRCSDYILRDYKNSIHVFLYASYEERIVNCVNSLFMTASEAKAAIRDVDMARENYHKHYAGYSHGDRRHYDILINTGMLGVEGTAQLLADLAKKKFNLEEV